MAVLFTEHSMDVVFAYADRTIVLARGRLIAQGKPAEIRDHPKVQEVYFGSGKTFEKKPALQEAAWSAARPPAGAPLAEGAGAGRAAGHPGGASL